MEDNMYILIPLCLLIAALFMWQEKQEKWVNAVICKGLASLCFIILGFLASKGSSGSNLIIAGLVLGGIADVLLNLRYVFKAKGQLVFLIGILVFLSGHIMYLAAVLPMNQQKLLCIIAGIVLTALVMKWIFTKITAAKAFKIFGIFYIGAIVILNCVAFGNMISSFSPFTVVFAAGSFLFLISDIVLILNTFGPSSKFSLRVTNLSLYYIGQLLIAFSLSLL
jgi:uncharacterized membrane protein YhhN